jgi:AcrR family transcriptional regulator
MTKHLPPEQRRRQFLEATGRVFIREGVAGVTMIAVAAEAGLSRRLLYDFFPDLRSLLRDYFFDALSQKIHFVVGETAGQSHPNDTPIDAVRDVFRLIVGLDDEQRLILELLSASDPGPDLALVGETMTRNLLLRWGSYEQLAGLSSDQVLLIARLMLGVILDLAGAVRSGVLSESRAMEAAVAVGVATVSSLGAASA